YRWDQNTYLGIMDGASARPFFETWLGGVYQGISPIASWPAKSGYDANSTSQTTADGKPTTNVIFVRPNRYEAGRANVVVFNWQHLPSVALNLSAVLKVGDQYVVQNVQDFYGAPAARGTYDGSPVTIPMAAVTPPLPIVGWSVSGWTGTPPVPTGPEFNTFVVLRTAP